MKISKEKLNQIIQEEIKNHINEITAIELAQLENDPFYLKRFSGDPEQHPEYQSKVPTYVQDQEINNLIDQTLKLGGGDMRKLKAFLQTLDRLLKSVTIRVDDAPTTGGGVTRFPAQHGYE